MANKNVKQAENIKSSNLRSTAEQGDAEAQCDLGLMYAEGTIVPEDQGKALELYERAAAQGSIWAMCSLGALYADREDNEKARYWYEQAYAQGDLDDDELIDLANLYYVDESVPQNRKTALKWYERAAYRGNVWAMNRLGDLYADGLGGVRHSYGLSLEWYERAAREGYDEAMYNLGFMYEEGEDYEMAQEWYEKAVAEGNREAIAALRDLKKLIKARADAA